MKLDLRKFDFGLALAKFVIYGCFVPLVAVVILWVVASCFGYPPDLKNLSTSQAQMYLLVSAGFLAVIRTIDRAAGTIAGAIRTLSVPSPSTSPSAADVAAAVVTSIRAGAERKKRTAAELEDDIRLSYGLPTHGR